MKLLKSSQFWLLLVPFLLWIFCFRFFLSGQGGLFADAISYYQHIGFFTDHLAKGQYPLWDPFWYDGAPYHFFLRRIGEFNPFYLILVVLKIFGASHQFAYLFFLTIYYALAVVGFYLLVNYLLRNQLLAYVAYLLLLFSSWGTQLFYNYIILLFVPLVWFFYFLIRFLNEQRAYQWIGLCFCLGLILTTYIPFYFLTILSLFILLGGCFYIKDIPAIVKNVLVFINRHRLIVLGTVIFLIICCYPGYVLYVESKAGEFVMPSRSAGSTEASVVAVSVAKVASGDFVNNSSFDKYIGGLNRLMFGDFFIPYAFILFLFIAAFARLNKLILTSFLMITALLLIAITQSTHLHQWLYDHIFFFKFIRNIYYFFWLAILPLSILWVCACLASLMKEYNPSGLSAKRTWIAYGICILLIIPQAVIIYDIITTNMRPQAALLLHKQSNYAQHRFASFIPTINKAADADASVKALQADIYYASRWYATLIKNVDPTILQFYGSYPLRFYDNVELLSDPEHSWKKLENSFLKSSNIAYIDYPTPKQTDLRSLDPDNPKVSIVSQQDPRVKWLNLGPNQWSLRIKLDAPKFLVIHNNFHSSWRAFVNGKPVTLFKANYSFQGLWLTSGESTVVLVFDTWWTYCWHWVMMMLFTVFLGWLIRCWVLKQ